MMAKFQLGHKLSVTRDHENWVCLEDGTTEHSIYFSPNELEKLSLFLQGTHTTNFSKKEQELLFELTRSLSNYGMIGIIVDNDKLTAIRKLHFKISVFLQCDSGVTLEPRIWK